MVVRGTLLKEGRSLHKEIRRLNVNNSKGKLFSSEKEQTSAHINYNSFFMSLAVPLCIIGVQGKTAPFLLCFSGQESCVFLFNIEVLNVKKIIAV